MTRFDEWSPLQCRIALCLFAMFTIACLAIALSDSRIDWRNRKPLPHGGDNQLYWDIVQGMRSGETFYQSSYRELRRHGYPTASVFNWRTPLPMWLLAQLPDPKWGRMLIAGLAFVVTVMFYAPVKEEFGLAYAIAAVALTLTALAQCFVPHVFILPMAWAAVLIGLSLGCFAMNRFGLAVTCGCAAPFFRDLALGYPLLMLLYALWHRRRMETLGWLIGMAVYLIFFYVHCLEVRRLIQESDVIGVASWIRFGGLPFLLATAQMNLLLMALPQWVTALYLPLTMLGFVGWKSAWGLRVCTVAFCYQCLFFVVGQQFNNYWGTLIAALCGLASVVGIAGLPVLFRRSYPDSPNVSA